MIQLTRRGKCVVDGLQGISQLSSVNVTGAQMLVMNSGPLSPKLANSK